MRWRRASTAVLSASIPRNAVRPPLAAAAREDLWRVKSGGCVRSQSQEVMSREPVHCHVSHIPR